MKRIFIILFLGFVCLAVTAQTKDTVVIRDVKVLKDEVAKLLKANKNLSAQIGKLKKLHQEDLEKMSTGFDETSGKVEKLNEQITAMQSQLDEHQKSADERIGALEKWSKRMVMIQFILFGLLFIILLILVIVNRTKVSREFLKLEAKVDNVKEESKLEIKNLQKKHEEDIAALKKDLESKKK